MKIINLFLKNVVSTGFSFITQITFEVDNEQALMAISDLPPTGLCPNWQKEIIACDGDILQAYLRIVAALINDSFSTDYSIEEVILGTASASAYILPLEGTKGIRLINFKKSRTPMASFQYTVGKNIILTYTVKHPKGIIAVYRVDTIYTEQIKKDIVRQGSNLFYWGPLLGYFQGNILHAFLAVITKTIAESFAMCSLFAIIDRMRTCDRLSLNLDGSQGIELISFHSREPYTLSNGPDSFKFIIEELS